jgi:mycothiol synthase
MEQLKMIRFFDKADNARSPAYRIPEGFFIREATEKDGADWCKCCLNGELNVNECSFDIFKQRMLDDSTVSINNIFMICDNNGNVAGTATARRPTENHYENIGILHMVAVADEYKGKGLAGPVCEAAVNRVRSMGYKGCYLSTDDFRLPAIKTYLKLSFIPIITDDEMRVRWEKVLKQLNIKSVKAVDRTLNSVPALEITD